MAFQLLERLGSPIKALVESRSGRLPYSTNGAYGGYYPMSMGADYFSHSPGAKYDYRAEAGELMENPVVAVCVRAVADALAAAPPYMEEKQGDKWVRIHDDPVTALLNRPMGEDVNGYGGVHLWYATAAFECTQGQAFWLVEWNKARTEPVELRIENPNHIRMIATPEKFIDHYEYAPRGGSGEALRDDQVIHFRAALHHFNPRIGWCPLQTGHRQVAGDNASATYHGALLRNHASISAIMTLQFSPESAQAAQVDPDAFEAIGKRLQQRYSGEGAGGLGYVNYPVDIKKLGLNPEEMSLTSLIDYYERRICALVGVDPMICGLGSGEGHRTYSNLQEALKDFWERRIQPHKARHSSELGAQLLPLFKFDAQKYRISWDYSQIDALNENRDEIHNRIDKDYQSGVIDLYTAQTERGIGDVPEDFKNVFHPSATPGNNQATPLTPEEIEKQKRLNEAAKTLDSVKYDPNQPRDPDGKFAHGGITRDVREWLGNSKITDSNGNPQVVFHGTVREFDSFDESHAGSQNDEGWIGRGLYFTDDIETAKDYGTRVIPVYLKIEKPFVFKDMAGEKGHDSDFARQLRAMVGEKAYGEEYGPLVEQWGTPRLVIWKIGSENFADLLRRHGHDGVIAQRRNRKEIVAFKGEQVRIAEATKSVDLLMPDVWTDEMLDAMTEEYSDSIKKYDPRQPRDDLGRWSSGPGGSLSVGHALHVMKHEGIHDEKHHDAVRRAIESGQHQTREDVLRHIDSIHAGNTAPKGKHLKESLSAASGDMKAVNTVLDTIHDVHSVGNLPSVSIKKSSSSSRPGAYHPGEKIMLDPKGETPELTLTHEIGHYLDHVGLSDGGKVWFSGQLSRHSDEGKALADALIKSEGVAQLIAIAKQKTIKVKVPSSQGSTYDMDVDRKYVGNYLLSNRELFARAYAQYVTTRSDNPTLKAQLNKKRESSIYPDQWSDKDFEPIAKALDNLFAKQGWLKKGGQ